MRLQYPGRTRTKDKYRVVYSDHQRLELEKEFHYSRYITIRRKAELAQALTLSERQVKSHNDITFSKTFNFFSSGENLVPEQASQGEETSEETWWVYYERQNRCGRHLGPSQPHGGHVRCVARHDVTTIKCWPVAGFALGPMGHMMHHPQHLPHLWEPRLRTLSGDTWRDLAQSAFHPINTWY